MGEHSLESIRSVVVNVLRPGNFFVAPPLRLVCEHLSGEEISWEVFRGRLLEPTQTRRRQTFEAWNLYLHTPPPPIDAPEPLLAIKLDAAAGLLHITRAIYCYTWEGYHAGENVYLSREIQQWVRELVGTVELPLFHDSEELGSELRSALFQAVVGASRLPLTSVEAPLPQFSLGQLGYCYRPHQDSETPLPSHQALVGHWPSGEPLSTGTPGERGWGEGVEGQDYSKFLPLNPGPSPPSTGERGALRTVAHWRREGESLLEQTKRLELVLRTAPRAELDQVAELFGKRWRELGRDRDALAELLRRLFDEVSLSPYTDFVSNTLRFIQALVAHDVLTIDDQVDFLSFLLRHLARHLTAYDLITFHHQGANYPDALLLDAALKEYLALTRRAPELFLPAADGPEAEARKRLRRRALRQGWLLRRFYEGLPVPDAPTSPGENRRILPPPHVRVPDEQIQMPPRRTRKLYAGDPLDREAAGPLLALAVKDLEVPRELRELGMALFLDRPLGAFKAPGEPDQTLLLSSEAFSRSLTQRRLRFLAQELGPDQAPCDARLRDLEQLDIQGLPLPPTSAPPRLGTVSLHDSRKAADDFLFLRTTRRSVSDFLAQFDRTPLGGLVDFLSPERQVLVLSGDRPGMILVHDAALRRRLELEVDPRQGYRRRAGAEYPLAGLRVLRVWNEHGEEVLTSNLVIGIRG